MTPTLPDNKAAAAVDRTIGVLANAGVRVVEALIIADAPYLAWPFVKQLWRIPFGWVASYFVQALKNGATFAVIDLQVGQEETAISKALAAVVVAQKSGDPQAIKKAIQDYANAQSALVHADGSHPVS